MQNVVVKRLAPDAFLNRSLQTLTAQVIRESADSRADANANWNPWPARPLPAALTFEYWQEDDGSWAAHCSLLGITAVGETRPELFIEASVAVEDFWDILNSQFDTLSDGLRDLLLLRQLGLRFAPSA